MVIALPAHDQEWLEWTLPGGGTRGTRKYRASTPPLLGTIALRSSPESRELCALAGLDLAVASRILGAPGTGGAALMTLNLRVEAIASSQVDGHKASPAELATCEAGLPSTRAARRVRVGVEALAAHLAAADRALGLGALAAAHTAPAMGPGRRKAATYRTTQTWSGGSDLWPAGAEYVPPRAERVPALMEDLVELCARTDVDPVLQAAIAHAQMRSIQPFDDDNDRAALSLINGVWRRRGLAGALVVPISAAILGDSGRYESAWVAFRDGDGEPIVHLVAHHARRAVKEATASAARLSALPQAWRETSRPRRGSAASALIDSLAEHPITSAADVMRRTGVSQASAYDAIVRLAEAGVLRRLSRSKRDTMWVAGAVLDEAERVLQALSGHGRHVLASTTRPRPSRSAGA